MVAYAFLASRLCTPLGEISYIGLFCNSVSLEMSRNITVLYVFIFKSKAPFLFKLCQSQPVGLLLSDGRIEIGL